MKKKLLILIFKSTIILLSIGIIGIILISIFSKNTIIAKYYYKNYKISYKINLDNNSVVKVLDYDTTQEAVEQYNEYERLNTYLSQDDKIDVKIKNKKIIFNMSILDFFEEIGGDAKKELISYQKLIKYLKENGYNLKISLLARINIKKEEEMYNELYKEIEDNINDEDEEIKRTYQIFLESMHKEMSFLDSETE